MDIAKLISGRVGKIGNTYSISFHLFDTQNVRAENSISEECKSEDELIPLARQAIRKLLGVEGVSSRVPSLQEEWTPISMKDLYTGMEFIFVKGGCYEMGDTFGDGDSEEKPIHEVCVDDFYLGKYEVTQAQWEKVMGNNPSRFKGREYPVEHVNWKDVQQFIDRLNNQSGRKYRLPTEAEWEYAARSGGKKEKFSGTSREDELDQYAWYDKNSGSRTHPVGQKRPNGLGFHDMSGNVWEWCSDWYDKWEYYRERSNNNPRGPVSGSMRVLRGGSWGDDPVGVRTAARGGIAATIGFNNVFGFRLGASTR
jgi:formylglycine-generating enzyme required for sulfatase activity